MLADRFVGVAAAIATGVVVAAINANDFDQEPPTDAADVVATLAVFIGAAIWFALGRIAREQPSVKVIRAIAAGVAIGALVTGLASAIYDPFAP